MFATTNSISTFQLFSPISISGINVVGRCKIAEVKKDAPNKAIKVPLMPSYLERIRKCVSVLTPDFSGIATKPELVPTNSLAYANANAILQQHYFSTRLLTGCSSVRNFRATTTIEAEEVKVRYNGMFMVLTASNLEKPERAESKENLTEVIKLLVSERKQDNQRSFPGKYISWKVVGACSIVGYIIYKNITKANSGKSAEDTGVTTKVTFDDIRGAEEVKAELVDIVEYLKDPRKFNEMGAKLPNGILLVGPPGTGKTLLAKAVAGEAGVSFFYASGSEFDEMLVGMGALRVRQLFDKARKSAPAIIFLDEIDACGGKRANTTTQPHARQTINQLLQEMDGFTDNHTVVVLAATNDANILDKALVRPGRFDTQVQVLLPDIHGRKEILQLYLDKLSSVDSETINLDKLSALTIEMTGADLSNLVNQAALRSIKLSKMQVDQDDLEFALDKVRMGPEMKSRIRTDKELKVTAYHEAGHALVAYYTPSAMNIYKATIMQRGPALGHVSLVPGKDDETFRSKIKLLASIDVCMGGRVAEELMFGKDHVSTGTSSDINSATVTAYSIVCNYGMSDKMGPMTYQMENLSEDTKRAVENEVKVILLNAYAKARKLLIEKPAEHKLLAEALLLYESLTSEEIKMLLQSKDINSIKVKRQKELEDKKLTAYKKLKVNHHAPVIDYIMKVSEDEI